MFIKAEYMKGKFHGAGRNKEVFFTYQEHLIPFL